MNSKLKSLIVCGVFVVCLAVVAFVLLANSKEEEKPKSDNSSIGSNDLLTQKDTPLFNYDKTQVKKIVVENEFGTISFIQNKSGGDRWTIEEIKDIAQSSTLTTAAANIAASVSYHDIVEEDASDLSKYGLAEPQSKFTVSYADLEQTVKTFIIGNETPKSGYFYICEEGQTKVYTASENGLRYYMNKAEYFVDKTMLETPGENSSNWPELVELSIKRTDWEYVAKFKTINEDDAIVSTQILFEPITMPLNVTFSSGITHGMWGLTSKEAIVAHPTEEDFAEYGLDNPFTEVVMDIETGDSYTLKIGKPIYYLDESGNETTSVAGYYAYIEGADKKDVIFSVAVENLPWATFKLEDAISTLMTTNYIYDVDTITIKNNSTTYSFDLIGEGESAPSKVTVNGNSVDVDLFRTLYQYILTCPTNEIYWKESAEAPYLTLEINTKKGDTDKLEFVKHTDRRTIVYLNGRPQFLIARTWTDLLLENITNLENGDEIKSHV